MASKNVAPLAATHATEAAERSRLTIELADEALDTASKLGLARWVVDAQSIIRNLNLQAEGFPAFDKELRERGISHRQEFGDDAALGLLSILTQAQGTLRRAADFAAAAAKAEVHHG